MIFLEASFLVSYYIKKDKYHKKAIKIMDKIDETDIVISKMVIFEVMTVLRKIKQSNEVVKEIYNNLFNMFIIEDTLYYNQALEDCLNNEIGFFNNLYHILMINNGIKEIGSFDKDFDYFNDIKRLMI